MDSKNMLNTDQIIKEHPEYKLEVIRQNAQCDVKEEREDLDKDEKKRKDRRNALVTTAIYLGFIYILYLAANQFTGFKLFSLS